MKKYQIISSKNNETFYVVKSKLKENTYDVYST